MEPIESDIEKAAGIIIEEAGINALTVDALALQMRISKNELITYFKNKDDILKYLASRLKNDIQQLINNLAAKNPEPEKELSDLFAGLYDFYNRKSYFLELMFADVIHENNSAVHAIIFEIRKAVGNYLTQILEQGKKTGVFNSHVSTRNQVESILYRFRFFMSDIPMTHKMISDLKMLRENEE